MAQLLCFMSGPDVQTYVANHGHVGSYIFATIGSDMESVAIVVKHVSGAFIHPIGYEVIYHYEYH